MSQRFFVILAPTTTGCEVYGNAKGQPFTSYANAQRSATRRLAALPKGSSLKIRAVQA